MPYKSEHAARQKDPAQFDDFRRVHESLAPLGIDFIYGIKDEGGSEIQSVRADAERWTVEAFREWLEEHELTSDFLVPANNEELNKGGASTPAKPSERIKGSDKNKAGSAGGERGGIKVSEQTESTLRKKAQEHNEAVKGDNSKRTNLGALKAVYRRGAGAFSTSHRPGMTRAQWAFARVNAFLHLLKTGKPKSAKYITDNDLLPADHPRSTKKRREDSRELNRQVRLPQFIRDALRKGLRLHEDGKSGDGLVGTTVRMATLGESKGEWSEEKIIKAAAWFERHANDRKLKGRRRWNTKGAETPGYVAWLLWGSDANNRGQSWIKKKAQEIKKENEMSQSDTATETELGGYKKEEDELGWYGKEKEKMAFEPRPGDPLSDFRDADSTLAPMIQRDDVDNEELKDLHVLRLGALYDLDSGELVMNLTEDSAREIARTTDRMLRAGHVIPISFEHGIEGGQRGQDGSDRRPYGTVFGVYYDEMRKGIYARKEWTKLGKRLLLDSMTEDGLTAMRVSPRVIMKPAYHPSTGERLGDSYMDVISLTTLPRQDSMEPVALSRTMITVGADVAPNNEPAGSTAKTEGEVEMTEKTEQKTVDVLLARNSEDARTIYKAAGLENDAPVVELARKFEVLNKELSRVNEELGKYKAEELARAQAAKEAEVVAFLDEHDVSEIEREFLKVSLLSDDEKTAELARNMIIARGQPDKLVQVQEAIENAKKRGAVPADFVIEGELEELSRTAPAVAAGMINAIPGETVVRVGEPAGSDAAGAETETTVNRDDAAEELSRIAREMLAEGKTKSLMEGHRLLKTERPELYAAMKEN